MDEKLDAYQAYLMERLRELQLAYEREAKPFIDKLVEIQLLRAPPPFVVALSQIKSPERDGT